MSGRPLDFNHVLHLIKEVGYTVISEVQIDVDNTAIYLPNLPEDAIAVIIQVQGGKIRYTLDGSSPTTNYGFVVSDDSPMPVFTVRTRANLERLQIVKDARNPKVHIAYGRLPTREEIGD